MKTVINWRAALDSLHHHWQASALPRLLAWWLRELNACLPASLTRALTQTGAPCLLHWCDGSLWQQGAQGLVPCTPQAQRRYVLVLGHGQALVRPLTLPAGAATNVTGVLAYEMDRYTPFHAQQVYFVAQHLPSRAGQPLNVTLAVTLRTTLEAQHQAAQALGIELRAVDVQPLQGPRLGINLLPPELRSARSAPRRRLNRCLAALSLALACVAVVTWQTRQNTVLETMQDEVTRQRSDITQLQALRQQLDDGLGARRYLSLRKQATPALSQVLDELTHCLPLDTWLTELAVDPDGQVNLAGLSRHAGELIGALKHCQSLTGAQFQGVIQPDETTGQERFYLLAHLKNEDLRDAPPPDAP